MNNLKSLAMLMATASLCLGSQADNDLVEVHLTGGMTLPQQHPERRDSQNNQIVHLPRHVVEAMRFREIPRPQPMRLCFQVLDTKIFRRNDGLFYFESKNGGHLRTLTAENMSIYLTLHNHLDNTKREFCWIMGGDNADFNAMGNELESYMQRNLGAPYSVSSYALEYVTSRPISPCMEGTH